MNQVETRERLKFGIRVKFTLTHGLFNSKI